MATRSEYRKHYRNYAQKASEDYQEHLRYRQLRRSAELAHHDWAWSGVECEDTVTPSAASADALPKQQQQVSGAASAATAAKTQKQKDGLKMTDLMPLSKRLSKTKPSLSTQSQSGSETDYEEREADLLDDPLAETAEEAAAPSLELDEAAERAKIRKAIREIKLKRQGLDKQPPEQEQSQRRQQKQQQRLSPKRSQPPKPAVGYSSAEESSDGEDADDDYEEQLAAARRRRLHRRLRQKQGEQQQQEKKQVKRREQAVPDCPPLELDRIAEESAQPLFYQQGQSQKQSLQQQQKQQQQAESQPIFYPWGLGDQERQYGLKRTFNVRATRDVYDSALRARDRLPRPRPATAGAGPSTGARRPGTRGGRSTNPAAAVATSAPVSRDDYWLSEYAKNFAKYANALYARNRLALASRARAADLL